MPTAKLTRKYSESLRLLRKEALLDVFSLNHWKKNAHGIGLSSKSNFALIIM